MSTVRSSALVSSGWRIGYEEVGDAIAVSPPWWRTQTCTSDHQRSRRWSQRNRTCAVPSFTTLDAKEGATPGFDACRRVLRRRRAVGHVSHHAGARARSPAPISSSCVWFACNSTWIQLVHVETPESFVSFAFTIGDLPFRLECHDAGARFSIDPSFATSTWTVPGREGRCFPGGIFFVFASKDANERLGAIQQATDAWSMGLKKKASGGAFSSPGPQSSRPNPSRTAEECARNERLQPGRPRGSSAGMVRRKVVVPEVPLQDPARHFLHAPCPNRRVLPSVVSGEGDFEDIHCRGRSLVVRSTNWT